MYIMKKLLSFTEIYTCIIKNILVIYRDQIY